MFSPQPSLWDRAQLARVVRWLQSSAWFDTFGDEFDWTLGVGFPVWKMYLWENTGLSS